MGEIKSSWEIARKKADALGDLSPEEQRKQKEDRYRPVGKSLADKYLEEQDVQKLEKELCRYQSEDKEIIRWIALRHLVDYIELQNSFMLDKVTLGIFSLIGTEKARKVIEQIRQLFTEYKEMERAEKQQIEAAGREILHQQRISGTAVSMINIRAKEEWQNRLKEVALPFEKQLQNLKQELLRLEPRHD